MPRAGLDPAAVVAAGADLADEVGFAEFTMAQLADMVGVRTPSLYKHIDSQDDLGRRIAVLALTEAGEAVGTAIQGLAGRDALGAIRGEHDDHLAAHAVRLRDPADLESGRTGTGTSRRSRRRPPRRRAPRLRPRRCAPPAPSAHGDR